MKTGTAFLSGFVLSMLGGLVLNHYINLNSRILINVPIPHQVAQVKDNDGLLDSVQLDCMARNIFFEARGESPTGKAMVGFVVLERVQSPHFPHSICGVVEQAEKDVAGNIIPYKCQFSWVCDRKVHEVDFDNPTVAKEWESCYVIAELVMMGKIKEPIDMLGVTHYHAKEVRPDWSHDRNFKLVARIGDHLFYRWKKAMLPKLEPTSPQLAMN